MKRARKLIPWLPLTSLAFYLLLWVFWKNGALPSPGELIDQLNKLFESHKLLTLIIATALESIVYVCLYVPGAFVIAVAVLFSEATPISLLEIALIVAVVLTLTSMLNYQLGHLFYKKKVQKEAHHSLGREGFFLSMLHPNSLAYYFFNEGLKGGQPNKFLLVPIFMIPYGYLVAWFIANSENFVREQIENPITVIIILALWLVIDFAWKFKKTRALPSSQSPS